MLVFHLQKQKFVSIICDYIYMTLLFVMYFSIVSLDTLMSHLVLLTKSDEEIHVEVVKAWWYLRILSEEMQDLQVSVFVVSYLLFFNSHSVNGCVKITFKKKGSHSNDENVRRALKMRGQFISPTGDG